MKKIWFKRALALSMFTCMISAVACDDDDSAGEQPGKKYTINHEEQWIGAPCTCTGSDEAPCAVFEIPIPYGSPIGGCDNMPSVPGAQRVCLRTILKSQANAAPSTYFPQGYCALGAISCEGKDEYLCKTASYGNVEEFTRCPEGSALLAGEFEYKIMGQLSVLKSRTCAKLCESDADCNTAGGMTCMERNGIHFCYNEKNFEDTGEPVVTAF